MIIEPGGWKCNATLTNSCEFLDFILRWLMVSASSHSVSAGFKFQFTPLLTALWDGIVHIHKRL